MRFFCLSNLKRNAYLPLIYLSLFFLSFLNCSCSFLVQPAEQQEDTRDNVETRFHAAELRRKNLEHYRAQSLQFTKHAVRGGVIAEEEETIGRILLRDAPEVRRQLYLLTNQQRAVILSSLERRSRYLPTIEMILRQYGLPAELSNLVILESSFNPNAGSSKGALGLWQLMADTARAKGLKVSFFEDERRDVRKSTYAAAEYISDLYQSLDDWPLVIAAYNVGPGTIKKIISQEGTSDFFELCRRGVISKPLQDFVARFIALSMIFRNPDVYGFAEDIEEVNLLFAQTSEEKTTARARLRKGSD